MSEIEIKRRQRYKQNRKKWTIVQIAAIAVILAIALGSFLIYDKMNRTYYIEYKESSSIDYKVQYKDNDFFEEEWLDGGQEYIASLINAVSADFNYRLNMDATGIEFDYKYKIDATVLVKDKNSGNPYYKFTENLLPLTSGSAKRSNSVEVNESITVDYNKYNDIASRFVTLYGLKNSVSSLVITLDVEVLSSSDKFEQNNQNKYLASLNIPLAKETLGIQLSSSVPESESKVLAYSGAEHRRVFYTAGITSLVLAGLLALVLVVFLQLTKNEDITYAAKVRKLLGAYSSYIQRMDGDFDSDGYQTVFIKTFTEMLGIRDTIQSPILMTENRDETMTRFLIPTNTKILYTYEIKVDNYDEIYARYADAEMEEAIILDKTVDAEEINEAMAEPDVILSEIEYEKDDDDEFEAAPDEPGVEVVGVVWPEKNRKNKVYRYDPDGEQLQDGDMVLVPTKDAARDREVIRKAAVAHSNHRVAPEHIKHPLKKIIGVIKHRAEKVLTRGIEENEKQ